MCQVHIVTISMASFKHYSLFPWRQPCNFILALPTRQEKLLTGEWMDPAVGGVHSTDLIKLSLRDKSKTPFKSHSTNSLEMVPAKGPIARWTLFQVRSVLQLGLFNQNSRNAHAIGVPFFSIVICFTDLYDNKNRTDICG